MDDEENEVDESGKSVMQSAGQAVDKTKEVVNDIKNATKVAAKAASGNWLGAAKDAIKSGLAKKVIKKVILSFIIKLLFAVIVVCSLAGALFGVFDAIKTKIQEIYVTDQQIKSKLWNKLFQDEGYWVDLEKGDEYVIDSNTGEIIGLKDKVTPEQTAGRTTTTETYNLVDSYLRELGNKGISLKQLRLLGDVDYSKYDTFDKIMADEEAKKTIEKYLAEFIRADIITQEMHKRTRINPLTGRYDLVHTGNQNKIDGGVFLYRTPDEGEIDPEKFVGGNSYNIQNEEVKRDYEMMEFVPVEDYVTALGKSGSAVNSLVGIPIEVNKSVMNNLRYKYTIDPDNGNLVLVETKITETKKIEKQPGDTEFFGPNNLKEWMKTAPITESKYTVTVQEKEYKDLISKYAMPYEYLISLCEITQNPEFVYHIAMLARDTEINLVILDDTTVKVTANQQKKYDKIFTCVGTLDPASATSTEVNPYPYANNMTMTQVTQTPVLEIDTADTWSYYDEYQYTKNVEGTDNPGIPTLDPPSGEKKPAASNFVNHTPGSTKEIQREMGQVEIVETPDVWSTNAFNVKTETRTETIETKTTYNESLCENSVEKSKQFLGLLRNKHNGKCVLDCYRESTWNIQTPQAYYCAEIAEFDVSGTNVQYKIPGIDKTESPYNKLTSGLDMLYALLQSNSSGYRNSDKILDEDGIKHISTTKDQYMENEDYEDAYVVRMQGLVEHMKYLMTDPPPTNEIYVKRKINRVSLTEIVEDLIQRNVQEIMEVLNIDWQPGSSIDIPDGDLPWKVWCALMQATGGNEEATAGAMGNIDWESGGFTATAVEGNGEGIGLVQWSFGRKTQLLNYARAKGVQWQDEDTQIEFLIAELTGTGPAAAYAEHRRSGSCRGEGVVSTSAQWATCRNINEATLHFMRFFESPTWSTAHLEDRQQRAQKWYELYAGKYTGGTGGTGGGGGNPAPGDLASLFPNGIPTSNEEMQAYLTTVQVPITTKSGTKTTTSVTVHKGIANQLINALQQAQNAGFKVYEVMGFSWRTVSGSSTMSQHSLGLAVDINVNENYCIRANGSIDAGSFWNPSASEYSIPSNGVLVNAFKSIGWGWGGNWSSKKDYMHFSFTGK